MPEGSRPQDRGVWPPPRWPGQKSTQVSSDSLEMRRGLWSWGLGWGTRGESPVTQTFSTWGTLACLAQGKISGPGRVATVPPEGRTELAVVPGVSGGSGTWGLHL